MSLEHISQHAGEAFARQLLSSPSNSHPHSSSLRGAVADSQPHVLMLCHLRTDVPTRKGLQRLDQVMSAGDF